MAQPKATALTEQQIRQLQSKINDIFSSVSVNVVSQPGGTILLQASKSQTSRAIALGLNRLNKALGFPEYDIAQLTKMIEDAAKQPGRADFTVTNLTTNVAGRLLSPSQAPARTSAAVKTVSEIQR